MKFKKFMPIFLIIVVFYFIYKNKKDKEYFASTSNGTLLQLRSRGYQDNSLTVGHSYYDASRGLKFRSYPRNGYGGQPMNNTHVGYPGGIYPLNYNMVNHKESAWL